MGSARADAAPPLSASAEPGLGASEEGPVAPSRVDALVVRAPDELDVQPVLELRMPKRHLHSLGQRFFVAEGTLHAFVEFRRGEGDVWEFALILSDGRAFFRELEVDDEDAARALGSSLEGLLAAVEEDRVEADALEEEIPDAAKPAQPEPEPEPEPEPKTKTKTKLAPEASYVEAGTSSLTLGGGGVVAMTTPTGLRAGGYVVNFDRRFQRGGTLVAAFGQDFSGERAELLTRFRIVAGGGYTWRGPRVDIPLWALASIDPWRVSSDGDEVTVLRDGQSYSAPLWGLGFRTGLRLRLDLPKRERVRLLLGLNLEVWMSGAGGKFEALQIQGEGASALGGGELRGGIEFGVRFGHPRGRGS